MKTTTYNGHKNWAHWNVSLWINNDEGLYRFACDLVRQHGRKNGARLFCEMMESDKTPDGARYTQSAVFAAMEGM